MPTAADLPLLTQLVQAFGATVTLVGVCLGVVVGFMNLSNSRKATSRINHLEISVNGRLTQLLELTNEKAHAEGILAGQALEKEQSTAHALELARALATPPPQPE